MTDEILSYASFLLFDQYLPVPYAQVKGIIDDAIKYLLEDAKLLVQVEGVGLRFSEFTDHPSRIKTPGKTWVYKPLIDIVNALADFLKNKKGKEASCTLEQKPYNSHEAETPGANVMSDAFLKLRKSTVPPEKGGKRPMADVVASCEFKTFSKNRFQVTIEDSTMAVWYFSRSHSAKSPDFDFTT
ncbi:hypothetical protein FRB90_008101, partial [Tulasnella sp. 427]